MWVWLHLYKALYQLLRCDSRGKLALFSKCYDFFLLLSLLDKHIVTSLSLCTCISAFNIFFKLLFMHNIFFCYNIGLDFFFDNRIFFLCIRLFLLFAWICVFLFSLRFVCFLWDKFETFTSKFLLIFYCSPSLQRGIRW